MSKPHLILGKTGRVVDATALENYVPPQRTNSHVPVHHSDLYEMTVKNLTAAKWEITEENLAIDNHHTALLMFCIKDQMSDVHVDRDFVTTVGIINNNMKKSAVKGFEGVRYHMCMNLQSDGEETLARKHTAQIYRDIEDALMLFVFKVREHQMDRVSRVNHYKNTIMSARDRDHVLMEAARRKIIAHKWLPHVQEEFTANTDEHAAPEDSAYLLNQAFTRTMGLRPRDQLQRTNRLTHLMDEKTGFQKQDVFRPYISPELL